jgi:hypothetical protein
MIKPQKPKGRPAALSDGEMLKYTITLPAGLAHELRVLGGNNVSAGVRIVSAQYFRKG